MRPSYTYRPWIRIRATSHGFVEPSLCAKVRAAYPQTIMYKGVGNLLVISRAHHEEVKQMVDAMHARMDREESGRLPTAEKPSHRKDTMSTDTQTQTTRPPLYSVCVNAAGCLPDSETYPHIVEGIDGAREALANEAALHILSGDLGGDDIETTARYEEALEDGGEALERGESVGIDMGGTYRLTIEPMTCEYSAGHRLRGEHAAAVEVIECGPVGAVPFCETCAAFYRRNGGENV